MVSWIVFGGVTDHTVQVGGGGLVIIIAGVYPRFELKPAATKVWQFATFTNNYFQLSNFTGFCKMPKYYGLIPQLKVQICYRVASNDAWKTRDVSKTCQLQCMLVKAMRRSLWRAGNHTGALSQRSFHDCNCERSKASSLSRVLKKALYYFNTQHDALVCSAQPPNTPHIGITRRSCEECATLIAFPM